MRELRNLAVSRDARCGDRYAAVGTRRGGVAVLWHGIPPLLLLLAGCGTPLRLAPEYRTRAYDAPGPAPIRAESAPPVDDQPLARLELESARLLALQRNHTVAAASAAVSAAEARIAEARAAFLPTLSMGLLRTFNSETRGLTFPDGTSLKFGNPEVTTGQARLSLSLFAFGRDVEAVNAARAAVDTEVLDERTARQKLLLQVTEGWYRIHEALAQILVTEDAVTTARQQLEDAASLVAAGRLSEDATLTAKVELLQKEQDRLVATNAATHARRILNVLLVRTPDSPLELAPAPEFRTVGLDARILFAHAREHNPAILSFRSRRDALESQRESVMRSLNPELDLHLAADTTDDRASTGYATNYSASLGWKWTPIDAGRRLGRLDEIHARLVQLRELELQALQDLELEITRLLLDLDETRSAYQVATGSIDAATENLRILQDRFRAGRVTAREILEAQRTLTETRFRLNRSRFHLETLLARLESHVGIASSDWAQ